MQEEIIFNKDVLESHDDSSHNSEKLLQEDILNRHFLESSDDTSNGSEKVLQKQVNQKSVATVSSDTSATNKENFVTISSKNNENCNVADFYHVTFAFRRADFYYEIPSIGSQEENPSPRRSGSLVFLYYLLISFVIFFVMREKFMRRAKSATTYFLVFLYYFCIIYLFLLLSFLSSERNLCDEQKVRRRAFQLATFPSALSVCRLIVNRFAIATTQPPTSAEDHQLGPSAEATYSFNCLSELNN